MVFLEARTDNLPRSIPMTVPRSSFSSLASETAKATLMSNNTLYIWKNKDYRVLNNCWVSDHFRRTFVGWPQWERCPMINRTIFITNSVKTWRLESRFDRRRTTDDVEDLECGLNPRKFQCRTTFSCNTHTSNNRIGWWKADSAAKKHRVSERVSEWVSE